VDPDNGPITTLDMAIEFAEENSIIRLAAGVYTLDRAITKPNLTIEQKDKDGQCIIIGNEKAVVNVKLKKGELVVFKRIIFAHSGIKLTEKIKEAMTVVEYRPNVCVKSLDEFDISREMDCVVCINSGGVILRECVISLNTIPNTLKQKFCAIVSFP